MNILMKGAMAAAMMVGGSVAVSAPAAAQTSFGFYVGSGSGYYDGYRGRPYGYYGDRYYRHKGGWRGYRDGYRYRDRYRSNWRGGYERCWREWRYDPYRDRRVRVRICR